MIEQVHPAALNEWFERSPAVPHLVLDVREPWEVQTASVRPQGFKLLPIPINEVASRVAELDLNARIACLCHHGARSQHVAAFLVRHGYQNVANVAGGIDAWSLQRDGSVPRY
jgi:rhodanese-related sulfurtransferase